MWKRREIAPKEQFLVFSTLFYTYISNFWSQVKCTHSFVKCDCSIYCFPHYLNPDMSRYGYLEVSPLEFEITRVDCSALFMNQTWKYYVSNIVGQILNTPGTEYDKH